MNNQRRNDAKQQAYLAEALGFRWQVCNVRAKVARAFSQFYGGILTLLDAASPIKLKPQAI